MAQPGGRRLDGRSRPICQARISGSCVRRDTSPYNWYWVHASFIAHQGFRQTLKQVGQNVEMPNFTQATYDAREIAMSRLQAEAERAQAIGVVGVRVVESSHVWGEYGIEFMCIGTAVRQVEDHEHVIVAPMVISLDTN